MRVPLGRLSQFQSKIGQFHAAGPSGAPTQSLRQEEFIELFKPTVVQRTVSPQILLWEKL